jgi:hypothetical protein
MSKSNGGGVMEHGDKREDHWMTDALVVLYDKGDWRVGEVDEHGYSSYWPWDWERYYKQKADAIKRAEDFCRYTKKPIHIFSKKDTFMKTVTAKELGR